MTSLPVKAWNAEGESGCRSTVFSYLVLPHGFCSYWCKRSLPPSLLQPPTFKRHTTHLAILFSSNSTSLETRIVCSIYLSQFRMKFSRVLLFISATSISRVLSTPLAEDAEILERQICTPQWITKDSTDDGDSDEVRCVGAGSNFPCWTYLHSLLSSPSSIFIQGVIPVLGQEGIKCCLMLITNLHNLDVLFRLSKMQIYVHERKFHMHNHLRLRQRPGRGT